MFIIIIFVVRLSPISYHSLVKVYSTGINSPPALVRPSIPSGETRMHTISRNGGRSQELWAVIGWPRVVWLPGSCYNVRWAEAQDATVSLWKWESLEKLGVCLSCISCISNCCVAPFYAFIYFFTHTISSWILLRYLLRFANLIYSLKESLNVSWRFSCSVYLGFSIYWFFSDITGLGACFFS